MALITRAEFARQIKELLQPLLGADAKKTTADRVLETFVAYADLAQGWDPTEEDDWQDVVETIKAILEAAK